jgi:hypothetical protein
MRLFFRLRRFVSERFRETVDQQLRFAHQLGYAEATVKMQRVREEDISRILSACLEEQQRANARQMALLRNVLTLYFQGEMKS